MVKLYYAPNTCAVACFIVAFSAGVKFETEQVDYENHITFSGADYLTINPKGNIPALVLDDGTVFNESSSVLQYIADFLAPPGCLVPINGTTQRAILNNVLSYITTEVQPTLVGVFFGSQEVRDFYRGRFQTKLSYLNKHIITDKDYLVGDSFTIVDSLLYVVLIWCAQINIDLSPYPKVKTYFERIGALKNVKYAMERMETNPVTSI